MRNYYRNYRKIIFKSLKNSPMKNQITIEEASSGLHFILRIKSDIDDEKFVEQLDKDGIKINPVSKYCYQRTNRFAHQFIVNYSGVEEENLKKAISIMSKELVSEKPNIKTPKNVANIISILENEGYEAFAVGGCVRDSILDRKPDDWDITTSALPEDVKRIFNRTFDTGIEHGTVTVRMGGESNYI